MQLMRTVTIAVVLGCTAFAGLALAQQPAASASSFPAGEKYAFVNIQRVAAESEDGERQRLT